VSKDDIEYYRERAATERNRAAASPTEEIADAHRKLAMMYENLLERLERAGAAQDIEPISRTVAQLHSDSFR
jgi:rubrerythrin